MKILIADDHTVVRAGIRQILLTDFPNAELNEAATFSEVQSRLRAQERWDLVILDMHMPGGSGLDLLRQIKQESAKTPVLILSMYPEDQFGVRAIKDGACAYLNKESAPLELIKAVRAACEGKRYLSPTLSARLATSNGGDSGSNPLSILSEREIEVLRLLYEGHALKEIAARLNVSTKTVSTYRHRILTKFSLTSNTELVQFVMRSNMFGSELPSK